MPTVSEVAAQLTAALNESQKAHTALEEAKAKLEPLETAATEADETANSLMREFQSMTGAATTPEPTRKRAGGKGGKRAPRSVEAVVMTSASRLLKKFRDEGKKKPAALQEVLDRAGIIASSRGGKVDEALRGQIETRANEVFKK